MCTRSVDPSLIHGTQVTHVRPIHDCSMDHVE